MKLASLLLFAMLVALPVRAFVIETEEGRKERETCIARIRAVFDFKVVDAAVRSLITNVKAVDNVSLKKAELGAEWTPQDKGFRSGSWWLSYEGGRTCSLTVYYMRATRSLYAEGDTAITFTFELEVGQEGAAKGRLVGLRYKDYTITSDHLWLSP